MAGKVVHWAHHQRVGNDKRKLILSILSEHADPNGFCWPSQARLALLAECAVKTVERHLKKLEQGGFLKRQKRGGNGAGRQSDGCQLNLDRQGELTDKAVSVSARGEQSDNSKGATRHSFVHSNQTQLCRTNRQTEPSEKNRKEESAELESSPTTDGASCASAREEDSKTDRQKQVLLAERILNLTASKAERFYQTAVESWGTEITHSALRDLATRIDGGMVVHKPSAIFALICRDLKDKPKPLPRSVPPWGSKDLGNGRYLTVRGEIVTC
jgi:Helix-turn-helix domain